MKVALATSLHLDHGAASLDARPGDPLPLQAFVPLGMLALKAFADREVGGDLAIEVRELNTLVNEDAIPNDDAFYDRLAEIVLGAGDHVAGFMTDADSLHHTVAIANRVKARSPRTHVCIGGPASSPLGARFLERFGSFDSLVRGEGEVTFAELLAALRDGRAPSSVAGLVWRDGEHVRTNPARKLIEDLDTLPVPDFAAYPQTATAALYLDVGRGCPFVCQFCATAPFWERRYRMKSTERIIAELRLLRDRYGRNHVNFSHDIFTANNRWTAEFCEAMAKANLGMTWTCSTRTDVIDGALLEKMAAAGCVEIYYGIESGSPSVQKRIRKNLDLERSRSIVRSTAAAGIRPVTGFIVGYPFETERTLSETLETFFDYLATGGFRAHLFTLSPFHESPMYKEFETTIGRAAEYHDLPLSPAAAAEGDATIEANRDLFTSGFRYASPELDHALVAATEELSPQLVVLRRIWPWLIPFYYDSVLDWYRRWVTWIGSHNDHARPGTRLRHQGDAIDLLQFLTEEIARFGLEGSALATLVRYETIKHTAAASLPPGTRAADVAGPAHGAVITRTCTYLTASFEHDLRAVFDSRAAEPVERSPEPVWIIFAKTDDGALHTVHANEVACRLLELAGTPQPVPQLIARTLACRPSPDDVEYAACRSIVENFVRWNLLSEASVA